MVLDLLKNLKKHKDCPRAALVIWEDAFEITEDVTWLSQEVREYSPHVFKQVGFIMLDCPQGVHHFYVEPKPYLIRYPDTPWDDTFNNLLNLRVILIKLQARYILAFFILKLGRLLGKG